MRITLTIWCHSEWKSHVSLWMIITLSVALNETHTEHFLSLNGSHIITLRICSYSEWKSYWKFGVTLKIILKIWCHWVKITPKISVVTLWKSNWKFRYTFKMTMEVVTLWKSAIAMTSGLPILSHLKLVCEKRRTLPRIESRIPCIPIFVHHVIKLVMLSDWRIYIVIGFWWGKFCLHL